MRAGIPSRRPDTQDFCSHDERVVRIIAPDNRTDTRKVLVPGDRRERFSALPFTGSGQIASPVFGGIAVNKAELIEAITDRVGDKKTASAAVEAIVETVTGAVAKGEKVVLAGFGVFEKVDRAARTARNPSTGATVKLKKTSVPKFRPGQGFKDVVSGAKKVAPAARAAAKAVVKAAPGRRAAAKAAPAKKAAVKVAAKKAPAKKAAVKKAAPVKRAVVKKAAPAKKAAVKKARQAAKKAPAKKAACQEGSGQEGRRQEGPCQEGRRQEGRGQALVPPRTARRAPTTGRGPSCRSRGCPADRGVLLFRPRGAAGRADPGAASGRGCPPAGPHPATPACRRRAGRSRPPASTQVRTVACTDLIEAPSRDRGGSVRLPTPSSSAAARCAGVSTSRRSAASASSSVAPEARCCCRDKGPYAGSSSAPDPAASRVVPVPSGRDEAPTGSGDRPRAAARVRAQRGQVGRQGRDTAAETSRAAAPRRASGPGSGPHPGRRRPPEPQGRKDRRCLRVVGDDQDPATPVRGRQPPRRRRTPGRGPSAVVAVRGQPRLGDGEALHGHDHAPRHRHEPGVWQAPRHARAGDGKTRLVGVVEGAGVRLGRIGFWYRLAVVLLKPWLLLLTKRRWRGFENVPQQGGVILAANHISLRRPALPG